jgi:hypothetical protein
MLIQHKHLPGLQEKLWSWPKQFKMKYIFKCLFFFLYVNRYIYSWDRASLDIEILHVTNKMQLFMIFVTNNALHVSGVFRPSSGAYELY